jgi:hypothetical protein
MILMFLYAVAYELRGNTHPMLERVIAVVARKGKSAGAVQALQVPGDDGENEGFGGSPYASGRNATVNERARARARE